MSADEHGDRCDCDGCVNTNYRRPRTMVLAELRGIFERLGLKWDDVPVRAMEQMEMFR